MRHTTALLAAVALLATGCSEVRSGTLGPAPSAVPPAESTAGPTPAPTVTPSPPATSGIRPPRPGTGPPTSTGGAVDPSRPETVTLQLWFTRAGRIAPTRRTRPATVATSRLALTELVAGPTRAEAAAGLATLLPTGVEIVRIVDGTATVAPPPAFADGGPGTVRLRQAQIVYTLTQFPTVRRVVLAPGDEPAGAPLGRGDFADLLPAIVVTGPTIGQEVTSPVTVTGTADVFEATVSVRVLDATGREIGTAFTTATCGSGCRGDYRATVAYRTTATGPGRIEVYEVSAKDGSRTNVVSVPVSVTASAR